MTLTELGDYSRAAAFLEKLAKVCSLMLLYFLMVSHEHSCTRLS